MLLALLASWESLVVGVWFAGAAMTLYNLLIEAHPYDSFFDFFAVVFFGGLLALMLWPLIVLTYVGWVIYKRQVR